jgi:hypothetical protein
MNKEVKTIESFECKDWLLHKHYAKRMCSISYAFGLYIDSVLCGVCTFGSPPSRALCVGVCGEENAHCVLELNRLCVNDGLPKNTLSYFVSQCLKMLPNGKIIVSYADTSQNHHGYIYQATNWLYTGMTIARIERYDINNPNKHSKSATRKKGIDYNKLAIRERPQKHRYVYFTGSKTNKKHLRKQLNYEVKPYPKGDNKRYDASYSPIVQSKLF